MSAEYIIDDAFRDGPPWAPCDMALLVFTLLELPADARIVNAVVAMVPRSTGRILVFIPDCITDILQIADANERQQKLDEYAAGLTALDKTDQFTNTTYPFYSNRAEALIEKFLAHGTVLERFETFTRDKKRTYALGFRRG